MHGHAAAFVDLGHISSYDDGFNSQFGDWLDQNYQLSCSSGWAYAIGQSTESEDQAESRFFDLVERFLEQWQEFLSTGWFWPKPALNQRDVIIAATDPKPPFGISDLQTL